MDRPSPAPIQTLVLLCTSEHRFICLQPMHSVNQATDARSVDKSTVRRAAECSSRHAGVCGVGAVPAQRLCGCARHVPRRMLRCCTPAAACMLRHAISAPGNWNACCGKHSMRHQLAGWLAGWPARHRLASSSWLAGRRFSCPQGASWPAARRLQKRASWLWLPLVPARWLGTRAASWPRCPGSRLRENGREAGQAGLAGGALTSLEGNRFAPNKGWPARVVTAAAPPFFLESTSAPR